MSTLTEEFEHIYQDNYPKVFAFIYNLTTDRDLTEDVTQEAMLKAYKHFQTFRQESSISVWLNKIAYHCLIDGQRKKTLPLLSFEDQAIATKIADLKKSLPKAVEQKLMSECIQSKILLLPDNYRAPLFLDMQGYNNQEIADILNISLDNAKIRLHRARTKLKEILGENCSFYYDERNVLL